MSSPKDLVTDVRGLTKAYVFDAISSSQVVAHFPSWRQMLEAFPTLTCYNCGQCLNYRFGIQNVMKGLQIEPLYNKICSVSFFSKINVAPILII